MVKRLLLLINIGLITLGIFFGVDLFYQVLVAQFLTPSAMDSPASRSVPASGTRNRQSGGNPSDSSFSDYKAIVARDLFKTAQAEQETEPDAEAIELDNLKETKLNLKLWGTVTGSPERAYAVIENKTKREQGLYHQGDTIQDATIKMILRKKVVLRVNQEDEILVMEDEDDSSDRPPLSSQTREPLNYGETDENIRIDKSEVDSVLNNINQLMQQAKVRPYFKDGKPSGLLLTHIRRNSFFTELGLQSGDIVKGVNGRQIESVDDALEFYNRLKSSSSVQLEIERRGEQKSISYDIN